MIANQILFIKFALIGNIYTKRLVYKKEQLKSFDVAIGDEKWIKDLIKLVKTYNTSLKKKKLDFRMLFFTG